MPKAASSVANHFSSSSAPFPAGSATNPNVLKRNQACHQCRRRKLKCDAKRPCGTCLRSHRNAVNHATAGVEVSPLDCTFDDVAEDGPPIASVVPKNRFERLESRIGELEALLRQSERAAEGSAAQSPSISNTPSDSISRPQLATTGDSASEHSARSNSSLSLFPTDLMSSSDGNVMSFGSFGNNGETTLDGPGDARMGFSSSFGVNAMTLSPPQPGSSGLSPIIPAHITSASTPPTNGASTSNSPPESNMFNQIMWPNWPADLPSPELLQHLVEVFFAFHPHAGRMFHGPTFLPSLALPPTHANFPHVSILHAICAVGSFYTVAVAQAPLPNFAEVPADELFQMRHRRRESRPDSFGEKHAKLARDAIDESTSMGEYLIECLQANILVVWFYHSHARWSDVFLMSGRALRSCVPLGLNMCPPFHSISKALRAPSILPPARTVVEDEIRRNTFWLAYAGERLHSTGNGWAMSLDDQDVSQLLPVRRDQFEQGVLVPPNQRQWAHSKDLLLNHPLDQTDSFTLYIKSTILLSRAKNFNLRFRAKNYAGESAMCPPTSSPDPQENGRRIDPRDTPGFQEIDNLVCSFAESFPRGLRNPINDNIVDAHLFTACLMPHTATILLHDPHADIKRTGCRSARKILEGARAVLDYIYAIWSTSYDISLVDNFCSFAWFMSGRVLVRFLKAAVDADDQQQLLTFRTELEFIRIVLAKVGERIPLAYRYSKMLDDILLKTVGVMDNMAFSHSLIPRFTSVVINPHEGVEFDAAQESLDTLLGNNAQAMIFG